MNPQSAAEALGNYAPQVREVLKDVIQTRHALAAEAHEAAQTRFGHIFGSQWRDLLLDAHDALLGLGEGFESRTLHPAGYRVAVVNGSLVYVWRDTEEADSVGGFASSATRRNGFSAHSLTQLAFPYEDEPDVLSETTDNVTGASVATALEGFGGSMPLVLVRVISTPRQLRSISWSVAVLGQSDSVSLLGEETIWTPEQSASADAKPVESFDSGDPVAPRVELLTSERTTV